MTPNNHIVLQLFNVGDHQYLRIHQTDTDPLSVIDEIRNEYPGPNAMGRFKILFYKPMIDEVAQDQLRSHALVATVLDNLENYDQPIGVFKVMAPYLDVAKAFNDIVFAFLDALDALDMSDANIFETLVDGESLVGITIDKKQTDKLAFRTIEPSTEMPLYEEVYEQTIKENFVDAPIAVNILRCERDEDGLYVLGPNVLASLIKCVIKECVMLHNRHAFQLAYTQAKELGEVACLRLDLESTEFKALSTNVVLKPTEVLCLLIQIVQQDIPAFAVRARVHEMVLSVLKRTYDDIDAPCPIMTTLEYANIDEITKEDNIGSIVDSQLYTGAKDYSAFIDFVHGHNSRPTDEFDPFATLEFTPFVKLQNAPDVKLPISLVKIVEAKPDVKPRVSCEVFLYTNTLTRKSGTKIDQKVKLAECKVVRQLNFDTKEQCRDFVETLSQVSDTIDSLANDQVTKDDVWAFLTTMHANVPVISSSGRVDTLLHVASNTSDCGCNICTSGKPIDQTELIRHMINKLKLKASGEGGDFCMSSDLIALTEQYITAVNNELTLLQKNMLSKASLLGCSSRTLTSRILPEPIFKITMNRNLTSQIIAEHIVKKRKVVGMTFLCKLPLQKHILALATTTAKQLFSRSNA